MLLQGCRWKWRGTSSRDFFKLSKKNLLHGCFHNLATFCKWFSGKNKGEKQQHYKKLKQISYFNFINIAECWCEIGCTSEGLTKVQVRNFPLLHFPRWLCLVHGKLAMSLWRVKRSVICKCQCFCLFDIQQWSVLS